MPNHRTGTDHYNLQSVNHRRTWSWSATYWAAYADLAEYRDGGATGKPEQRIEPCQYKRQSLHKLMMDVASRLCDHHNQIRGNLDYDAAIDHADWAIGYLDELQSLVKAYNRAFVDDHSDSFLRRLDLHELPSDITLEQANSLLQRQRGQQPPENLIFDERSLGIFRQAIIVSRTLHAIEEDLLTLRHNTYDFAKAAPAREHIRERLGQFQQAVDHFQLNHG